MIRQPGEDVGEPSLRIDVVEAAGLNQRVDRRCATAPSSEPAKVQLRRPTAMGLSLCTSFSSVWKHWKLVFVIDATRATCSPDRGDYLFMLQVGSSDLVRSPRHDLISAEDAVLDEPTDAMVRDAERRSGFRHREPLAVLLGGAVGVD